MSAAEGARERLAVSDRAGAPLTLGPARAAAADVDARVLREAVEVEEVRAAEQETKHDAGSVAHDDGVDGRGAARAAAVGEAAAAGGHNRRPAPQLP